MAEKQSEGYGNIRNLGECVNTVHNEYAYVAPDESFMLISMNGRGEGLGEDDLYVSFRDKQGGWKKPVNLGPRINSPESEIYPNVTPDGKYIFFVAIRNDQSDIMWVSSEVLKALK